MNDDPTPTNLRPHRRRSEVLEDLSLALREHLLWPVEDHLLGLGDRGRVVVAGAAVVVALGLGIAGYGAVGSGGPGATNAAQVAALPGPKPQAAAAGQAPQPAPTLHGAAPVFKPPHGGGSIAGSKAVERESAAAAAANTGDPASDTISTTPAVHPAGASASAAAGATPVDGPPAGPAAVAVARKFAGAFVVYETGGDKSAVRKAFKATAVPGLTKALLQRPPRQPTGVEVPQAKVLNVVPAPSHGRIYPLSVSLLRVGVTSELRLEMEQLQGKEWRVTNVLG